MLTKAQLKQLRKTPQTDSGSRFRAAMELLDVTQLAVATGTGFGQPYVSVVHRGVNETITVQNARKFAAYFGCTIEDLFPQRVQEAVSA